jgi:hypothetical protein
MTDISRREALAAMAALGATAAVGQKQAPQPPGHVQMTEAKRVLTPADLSFAGYLRFPPDLDDLWYAYGQLAKRVVNGQTRIFTCGNAPTFNILEYELAGTPSSDITAAPRLRPIRNWGAIPQTISITGGAWNQWVMGGLLWDEPRQLLWGSYGDSYAPVEHAPSIFAARLNADGTVKFFGPWRTQLHSFKTCGALLWLPQDFADTYLGAKGKPMLAVSAGPHNKDSYFGPGLAALNLDVFDRPGVPFDPFTTPPDKSELPTDAKPVGHITLGCTPLIGHDILDEANGKRMKRSARYQQCNWVERYDCSKGTVVIDGTPLFAGYSEWLGNSDQDAAHPPLFITTKSGKTGVVFLGQMADTPDDYTPPGGKYTHVWYGATTDSVPGATRPSGTAATVRAIRIGTRQGQGRITGWRRPGSMTRRT